MASLAAPYIAFADERPNVVLFIGDDINWNDYGCYGNAAARTPHIDALAAGGVRFTQAYLTASSCSPSRSSIVTGRYPHNNGAASELHLPIAGHLPWFPAMLREAGYYTAIVGKHHMSTTDKSKSSWRERAFDVVDGSRSPKNSGGHAHWVKTVRERPRDKPFFFWFAAYDAHRGWDGDRQWQPQYGKMHAAEDVAVPPYLADDEATREDLASYYNEVTRFDHYIGEVVAELKRQNALDNTLLWVMADNGRPFPRAKTRLHDSGMKTALVAHWPAGIRGPGDYRRLVSAIDLAPTILELAGVARPATMQGISLVSVLQSPDVAKASPVRTLAFSEHNWHDYEAHGRSVRDSRFLYIRNQRTEQAWQGPADSVRSPSHQSLQKLHNAGKTSKAQADVFLAPRPAVELYDTQADPWQFNNLAGSVEHQRVERELAAALGRWTAETGDTAPSRLSADSFDRATGKSLNKRDYRGDWPGRDTQADKINAPGPR